MTRGKGDVIRGTPDVLTSQLYTGKEYEEM